MPGGSGVCFVEDVQMKRRGFTLIELLVVVAIIALLIAILLPSLGKARELANRGTCAANVRGIAQSMHVYGADNDDVYPCVPAPLSNASPTYKLAGNAQGTGGTTTDLTYSNIYQSATPPTAGCPQACLWILCIRGDVAPKQFLCKSDPVGSAASPLQNSATPPVYNTNFTDASGTAALADNHYSYSVSYPWTASATSAPGGWWKATSDATIVLMADMSPLQGTPAGPNQTNVSAAYNATSKLANSIHHQRDGQNVSFGDAHAEFQRSPFVGQNGDNIYTTGITGPSSQGSPSNPIQPGGAIPSPWNGGSAGSYDTILVPAANCSNNTRIGG